MNKYKSNPAGTLLLMDRGGLVDFLVGHIRGEIIVVTFLSLRLNWPEM